MLWEPMSLHPWCSIQTLHGARAAAADFHLVRCRSSVPDRLSNVKSAAAPAAASAVEASSAAWCSISPAPPASSPTHLAGRLRCGLHHQAHDSVKCEAELHSIAYRYTDSFDVEFKAEYVWMSCICSATPVPLLLCIARNSARLSGTASMQRRARHCSTALLAIKPVK